MSEAARPGGTYQTLDEQREKLSPAEERFERFRQTIGLFLGPIVFLALYFIPLGLEPAQQALAAIFAFVIVYWLTEPIPIPVTAVLLLLCAGIWLFQQSRQRARSRPAPPEVRPELNVPPSIPR